MKVIILDGPWRGLRWAGEGFVPSFRIRTPRLIPAEDLFSQAPPIVPTLDYEEYVYYIHRFKFGSRCILAASLNPAQPNEDDAWELMLTPEAKEAELT